MIYLDDRHTIDMKTKSKNKLLAVTISKSIDRN